MLLNRKITKSYFPNKLYEICNTKINVGEDLGFIIHAFSSHEVMGWNTYIKYKKSILRIVANIM